MISRAGCTDCGACRTACPHPNEACTACGACIPSCRGGYRKIAGETWSADALAARLKKDADVYALSGGGITFSGGEPLMQWPFVRSVLDKLSGVHTAIETSGFAPDAVLEEAMNSFDLVMMDWKVSDPAMHKRYTGVNQDTILRHARMLAAGNTPFILRMPIIPGVNDNQAHFETAAALVQHAKSLVRIEILPYQRAAGAKYEMIAMDYAPGFDENRAPQFFTQVFARKGIPFRLFK
jgi:pyruvate formate lyase activating enzyme